MFKKIRENLLDILLLNSVSLKLSSIKLISHDSIWFKFVRQQIKENTALDVTQLPGKQSNKRYESQVVVSSDQISPETQTDQCSLRRFMCVLLPVQIKCLNEIPT